MIMSALSGFCSNSSAGSNARQCSTQTTAARVLNTRQSAFSSRKLPSKSVESFKLCALSDPSKSSRHYLNLFANLTKRQKAEASEPDLTWIIAKYCPALVFHHQEKYICCNEEYYVDSEVLDQKMDDAPANTILEQLQKQLRDLKKKEILNEEKGGKGEVEATEGKSNENGFCMDLVHRNDRASPKDINLSHIPMYAKVRRGKLESGQDILDIYYFAVMSYSGPTREYLGSHTGDCESMIVRCTTHGHLISVHYGAHKEQNGQWLPAQECPVDCSTGRLLGFVGLHGHGIYPNAGRQACSRDFFLHDDITSSKGRFWASKLCLLVGYPDHGPMSHEKVLLEKLRPIESNNGCEIKDAYMGEMSHFSPALMQTRDDATKVSDVQVQKLFLVGKKKRVNAILRSSRRPSHFDKDATTREEAE